MIRRVFNTELRHMWKIDDFVECVCDSPPNGLVMDRLPPTKWFNSLVLYE